MVVSVIHIFFNIIYLALLFLGLIQCRKYAFKAGFYFFLLLIVQRLSAYIYLPILNSITNSMIKSGGPYRVGMTISGITDWFTIIPTGIQLVAFAILVVGLYKMWRKKTLNATDSI